MASVEIRCVYPCYFKARSLVCGEVVTVTALEAADLLGSARCELVCPADRAIVNAAIMAENAKLPAVEARSSSWVRRVA